MQAEITEIIHPDDIQVIRVLNPFDPRDHVRETLPWAATKTLRDYFPAGVVQSVVSVNGRVVPEESWGEHYLDRGDNLVICPVPAGGGGSDKGILGMVAMIAVSIFAPYAAGAMYAAMGGTYVTVGAGLTLSAMSAGITIAGSMLVSSMVAASQKTDSNEGSKSSYGIDGAKNTALEGIPVPVCYGRFRTGGNIISMFTELDGDSDDQVLYMLINAGEGPIAGISNIEVNSQPIEDFKGAEFQIRQGFSTQTLLPWFSNTIVPQNQSQKLTTEWSTYTTNPVDRLRFDFACPLGLFRTSEDSGDLHRNSVEIEAQYRKVGATEWLPLRFQNVINGGRGVYLDYGAMPVDYMQDDDGNWWHLQAGDAGWVRSGPPNGVWRYADTLTLVSDADLAYIQDNYGSWVGAGTSADGIPQGGGKNDPGAKWVPSRATGSVPVYADQVAKITGRQRSTLRRSFMTATLDQAAYDVRVRRTTDEDKEDQKNVNTIVLTDINEIQDEPLIYPNTALVGVRVKLGEQINSIPTVTFINEGKLVSVWGKPVTGATADQWYAAPSSNPAWIVWDMLTNKRYGGAIPSSRLDFSAFKKWAAHCDASGLTFNGPIEQEMNVWDAAQLVLRCGHAQLVPTGTRWGVVVEMAGTPAMMFSVANMVQDSYKESWLPVADRANEIDVTFFDKANDYKQRTIKVVDPAAITAGRKQRQSAITLFGVDDLDRAYKEGLFQLNLNYYILKTVSFSAPLEAIACTVGDLIYVQHDMPDWAQAGRFEAGSTTSVLKMDRPVTMVAGKSYKVLVLQDKVQRATGTIASVVGTTVFLNGFAAAVNATRLVVGTKDVAVREVFNGSVVVDDATGLAPGQAYTLFDTDVVEEAGVVLAPGDQLQITLQSPLTSAPGQFVNWMFGEVNKVKQIFRIKSITADSDHVREITALQYDERMYDTLRFPSVEAPAPNAADAILTQVRNLEAYEETRIVGAAIQSSVQAGWMLPASGLYAGADVYVQRGSEDFVLQETVVHRMQVSIPASRGEQIAVRVVAFDTNGKRVPSDAAPIATLQVIGEIPAIDVGSVTGVAVMWSGRDCRLTWRYNSVTHSYEFGSEPADVGADAGALDPHFKDYEIRVFEQDQDVTTTPRRVEYVADAAYTYAYEKNLADGTGPARALKFEIRMRDIFNNLGEPATVTAINTVPQIIALGTNASFEAVGLAWTHSEDPDFAGVMVWMSASESDLAGPIDGATMQSRLVYDGSDKQAVINGLMFNTTYYVRAAAYDVFSKTGLTLSPIVTFHTPNLDVNALANGVIGTSKLATDLQDRISLVDGPSSLPGSVAARILSEQTARTTADSANATAINTVSTTVGEHTTTIQTQQTSINGLSGQYTVKIDANGYVAGFGLATTANNGVPSSEFIIRADKFAMVMPSYPNVYPFTIGAVNGVPRVIISSALFGDATIGTAHLGDLSVTNAKVGNFLKSNTFDGTIDAAGNISNFGSNGWAIDKYGRSVFTNVIVRKVIDPLSNQVIPSVGSTSYMGDALETGSFNGSAWVPNPWTHSNLRIYGPAYHSVVPLNQRARYAPDASYPVTLMISVTGVVDTHMTLWQRFNGGPWSKLWTSESAGISGDGFASVNYTLPVTLNPGDYLDFGITSTQPNDTFVDSTKRYVKAMNFIINTVNV